MFVCLLYFGAAALLHFSAQRSQPVTTGPEDDYAQHYAAAENGSTPANGTKYLQIRDPEGERIGFFAQESVSRRPIKLTINLRYHRRPGNLSLKSAL